MRARRECLRLILLFACGCTTTDRARAREVHQRALPAASVASGDGFAAVPLSALQIECGLITETAPGSLVLRSACIRAVVGDRARPSVALSFSYQGPSSEAEPLASGEVRRQIGLKLRAKNTCNVVYVMWHIEPTQGIHVSVKSNPAMSEHAQCGDRGYINLTPSASAEPASILGKERHTLTATLDGDVLRVRADAALVWQGRLPREAFAFNGPVGVRSDNGQFAIQLRVAER